MTKSEIRRKPETQNAKLSAWDLRAVSCRGGEGRNSRAHIRQVSSSEEAKRQLFSLPSEPPFIANWEQALMIHYEVEASSLQEAVPFELDLHCGRALVSVVAFTMRGMRPSFGGRLGAWLLRPIATHHFLNVRTYVRQGRETGIYF